MSMPETIKAYPAEDYLERWDYTGRRTPILTSLFRSENMLDTVLDLGVQSYVERSPDRPFRVLSVGCSFGPEVDSALAYLSRAAPGLAPISIRGVDLNTEALATARQGRYKISRDTTTRTKKELEAYGFILEEDPAQKAIIVNAEAVRADHDVAFVEADMGYVCDEVIPQKADVVLCNNVLYHLTPEDASNLVRNLVKHLATGAIMSCEFNSGTGFPMRDSELEYTDWRIDTGRELAAAGVLSVALNNRNAPHIFRATE